MNLDHLRDHPIPDNPGWKAEALCAQVGGDWWHLPDTEPNREAIRNAKACCRLCDVQTECLLWAISRDEQHGIWGGVSPKTRTRINRVLRIPVTPRHSEPAHGTSAGERHHRRLGQRPCAACQKAANLAKRQREAG